MKKRQHTLLLILVIALTTLLLSGCFSSTPSDTDTPSDPQDNENHDEAQIYSANLDSQGFWENIVALDLVDLAEHNSILVPASIHQVSQNDLNQEMEQLLSYYMEELEVVDRAVINGDTVNIDYVGRVDDVAFEGGSTDGMGTKVTIGVTNYIDDFLEQLIGHSPGDSFDVFVTFPQDYGVENLNGKEAVFAVTINHIVEEKVPELNDDFVKQNFSSMYGWETVAELETELMNDIRKESIDQFIETYIVENSTVSDLPEFIITYHENSMIHFYEHSAANYGMELEEFLPLIAGVASVDELRETYYDYHSEVARFFVIVQAIAEDANITVTETSLKNYFQENFGSEDYSDFEDYYGLPYLKMTVLHQLVFEYLNDNLIYE